MTLRRSNRTIQPAINNLVAFSLEWNQLGSTKNGPFIGQSCVALLVS